MAYSVITTQATQFSVTGGTTAGNTTTGADALFVVLPYYKSAGANLSDSKGNTWVQLTKYEEASSNSAIVIYYASAFTGSFTVGTSHTFTTTSHFGAICLIAVSGARTATSATDQQNGTTGGASANPQSTGSITPSVDNCLVLTGFYQAAAGSAPTIPSGYTSIGTWATGTAFLGGAAYKIQTTATATNPSWVPGNAGSIFATDVASFFPPAVAVTANGKFFVFF